MCIYIFHSSQSYTDSKSLKTNDPLKNMSFKLGYDRRGWLGWLGNILTDPRDVLFVTWAKVKVGWYSCRLADNWQPRVTFLAIPYNQFHRCMD